MKRVVLLCSVALVGSVMAEGGEMGSAVRVLRQGREAFVRRVFNATEDIVIHVNRGPNEDVYLVPRAMPTADVLAKGRRIHDGGDDWPATYLSNFGYLGGNHGTAFAALQTVEGHGFTAADVGRVVTNEGAGEHVLVSVPDADHLLVHPTGLSGVNPCFHTNDGGKFACNGREWTPSKTERRQIYPMTIYTKFAWSGPDGRDVPEGREVRLDHLDLDIENAVVDPRAVLAWLRDHRGTLGKLPAFKPQWDILFVDTPEAAAQVADFLKLPRLMSIRTRYRYTPNCARLIDRKLTFESPLAGVQELGLCYGWNGREDEYGSWEFYIPGLKKMTLKGFDGGPDIPDCDFTGVMKMDRYPTWKACYGVSTNDMVDPARAPDRFVRLASRDGRRTLGLVLGYSPIRGMTARRYQSKHRESPYFFYYGGKVYPRALNLKDVQAGEQFGFSAYTQYFDPTVEPDATVFYHHPDGEAEVVWLDFHKPLKNKRIVLPAEFVGRKVSVVEKSSSVTLKTKGRVTAEGLLLDVLGNYGEIVLRLDGE